MSHSELTRSSESPPPTPSPPPHHNDAGYGDGAYCYESDESDTETDEEYLDSLSASSPRVVIDDAPPRDAPPRPPGPAAVPSLALPRVPAAKPPPTGRELGRQKSSPFLGRLRDSSQEAQTKTTVAAARKKLRASMHEQHVHSGPLSPRASRVASVALAMRSAHAKNGRDLRRTRSDAATTSAGATATHSDDGCATSEGTPRSGGGGGAAAATAAAAASEFDDLGFRLPPAAVGAYRAYKAATVGQDDAKCEQYRELVDAAPERLRDHKVTALLHIGLPPRMRRQLWLDGSGVRLKLLSRANYYERLGQQLDYCMRFVLNRAPSGHIPRLFVDDPDAQEMFRKSLQNIDTDIHRTLGENRVSDADEFTRRLLRILQLYCLHVPHEGYSQGMHFFGMAMLVHGMSDAETFWMLDHITQTLFPLSFDRRVTGQVADQNTFCYYASKAVPKLCRFLERAGLDLRLALGIELFGALGHSLFPHHSMYVLWDWLFLAGAPAFFSAALKIASALNKKLRTAGLYKLERPEMSMVKARIRDMLLGIVDMPLLLGTTKLPREIDQAALAVRRNREREVNLRHGLGKR